MNNNNTVTPSKIMKIHVTPMYLDSKKFEIHVTSNGITSCIYEICMDDALDTLRELLKCRLIKGNNRLDIQLTYND